MPTRNLTHLLNEVRTISKVDGHLNVLNGGWVLEYFQMDLPPMPYVQDFYWSVVDNCTCPVQVIDRPGSTPLITRNYRCTGVILGCKQRSLFCDH